MRILQLILLFYCYTTWDCIDANFWHLINANVSENNIENLEKSKYKSIIAENIRKSWNIHESHDINSYWELNYDKAIDIVYQHQHPAHCSHSKFLVSTGYRSGYGSEIHIEGLNIYNVHIIY